MPLQIVFEDRRYRPVVLCDHCGRRIQKATDGNYHFKIDDTPTEVLMFSHKTCFRALEATFPELTRGADELSLLPLYLGNSLELDWDRARENLRRRAEIDW